MSNPIDHNLTRRRVLQGTVALAAGSLLPKGAFAQSNPQPEPNMGSLYAPTSPFTITTKQTGTIGEQFVGISFEKSHILASYGTYISPTDTTLIGLLTFLSGSTGTVLRIGGDAQDTMTYNTTGFNSSTITNLAQFVAKLSGWKCIYGINLKGSALPTGTAGYTTTALAAQEASDAQASFAANSLVGIALGNEPDDYTSPAPYPYASVTDYEPTWNQYRQAVAAIRPTAPAVVGSDTGTNPNAEAWTEPFGTWTHQQSIPLPLLTQHYYIANGQSYVSNGQTIPAPTCSDLALWSVPGSTGNAVNNLLYHFANYLQAATTSYGIPWRLTECNSYYGGGSVGVSDSFASALWVIDYLFAVAQAGGQGVNFHTGAHASYSAIFDAGGPPTCINPLFYGMKLFNMGLNLASSSNMMLTVPPLNGANSIGVFGPNNTENNVTAYCVQQTGNTATIIMTNKGNVNFYQPVITVPWQCTSAKLEIMTVNDPKNTGVKTLNWSGNEDTYIPNTTIGGASINLSGGFNQAEDIYDLSITGAGVNTSTITCWLPIVSAVLITLKW